MTISNRPRYNKTSVKFICDKVSDGMSVEDICKNYPDKTPTAKTFWQSWHHKKPFVREEMQKAWVTCFWRKMDRMDQELRRPLPSPDEIAKMYNIDPSDKNMVKAYLNAYQRQRRDEFDKWRLEITKLAPKIGPREMSDRVKVEHTGNTGPTIVIADYSKALPEKIVNRTLEDKSDE